MIALAKAIETKDVEARCLLVDICGLLTGEADTSTLRRVERVVEMELSAVDPEVRRGTESRLRHEGSGPGNPVVSP